MALIDTNFTVNANQINELRTQLNTPQVQELRSAALATPEGQQLKQQLDQAYAKEAEKIRLSCNAAVSDTKGLMRSAGVSEDTIRQVFAPSGQGETSAADWQNDVAAMSGGGSGGWEQQLQQAVGSKDDAGKNYMLEHTKKTEPLTSDNVTAEDQVVISKLSYASNFAPTAIESNVSLGVNADPKEIEGYYAYQKACSLDSTGGKEVTVGEYCQNILNVVNNEDYKIVIDEKDRKFLEEMAKSERYKDLVMDHSDCINTGNVSTQLIVVRNKDEEHAFIGVQGTNVTTQDWVTNPKFAGPDLTDEEKWLVDRVNRYIDDYDSLDVAGHSQGGREAITISILVDDPDKIRTITSLDGPGFSEAFLEKYGPLFELQKDKIVHIYPKDSIVGYLLYFPGGEEIHVDANDFLINNHHLESWRLDENGKLIPLDDADLISDIIRAATEYFSSKVSPEVLEEILPHIMRLMADPDDASKMDFKNIVKNLDTISFGEANMYLAVGLVLICDGYVDLYNKVSPYLDYAKTICIALSLIPWPGAVVCARIAGFLENLDGILSAVEKVAKVISTLCEWYLEYKAKKLKEERQNYLNANPSMRVNLDQLALAYENLVAANKALSDADEAYDKMWHFFEGETLETGNFILDGIAYLYKVVTNLLSPAQAVKRLGHALLDLVVLQESSHVKKGIQAIDMAVANARSISGSICGQEDKEFFVHPQQLTHQAEQAEKAVRQIRQNTEEARAAITEAGSIWQADDYTSINAFTAENMKGVDDALANLEGMCTRVRDIATAYSNFQASCVEEFQSAKI